MAQAQEPSSEPIPGTQLRARLEQHLEARRAALLEEPTHYALVFELEQPALLEFMKQIQFHVDGSDYVLGVEAGPEIHGGGVLALLLDLWRPEGRPSRLEDVFWFAPNRRSLELREIYRSHKRQIFLPVPGKAADQIDGDLPETPQLPRMRFRYWTQEAPVETDAYKFLGLLLRFEAESAATWHNHLGQELSLDLLLSNVRGHYLAERSPASEVADHSNLHLVELLLAWQRRRGDDRGAEEVKRRFLEVALSRRDFGGEAGTEALGHYAESLGLLLADPHLAWRPEERARVRAWLAELERERFRDLDAVQPQFLAHLLRGLRLVEAYRTRL